MCDELGVEPDDVTLRFGDTASTPRGVGTFASRSVAMGGSALLLACRELRAKIERLGEALDTGELREIAAAAYDPGRLPPGEELGLGASARFTILSSGLQVIQSA